MSNYGPTPGSDPTQPYGQPPQGAYGQTTGQPGGYGQPTGQPYGQTGAYGQPGPGALPSTDSKGFFGALFDLSFRHFVTPMVVKFVYVLGMIMTALMFLAGIAMGLGIMGDAAPLGLLIILATPVVALLNLCFFRMSLEFNLALVRMSQDINRRLPQV